MKRRSGRRAFEQTRWSLVVRAGGPSTAESRAALAELCVLYRPPLLAYAVRFVKDHARAEDMVQDFLTRLVERDVLGAANSARGRFRAFLKTAIRRHIFNARETEQAQKRGGNCHFVDSDTIVVQCDGPTPEQSYDRQCAWELLDRAYTRLREDQEKKGHGALFEALRGRLVGVDDDVATLQQEALRLGIASVRIRVALIRLRKNLGDLIRDEIAQTVACPEDIEGELHELMDALRGTQ